MINCSTISEFFDGGFSVEATVDNAEIIAPLPSCRGVVVFADKNDHPIQLLIAANIKKTVKKKLAGIETKGGKKEDISQLVGRVYYCRCYCDFKSNIRFYQIAAKLYPDGSSDIIKPPKAYYLKIDKSSKWPFFSVTDEVSFSAQKIFIGPFSSRKTAGEYAELIEQAFLLCRRPGLIGRSQKASSCPYLQMDICPGVCAGRIGREEYLQRIEDAIAAATGNIDAEISRLRERMLGLSQQMEFEKAQAIKTRLAKLELMKGRKFRWITNLDNFRILHIDRREKVKLPEQRKKVQMFDAFIITAEGVCELASFSYAQTEQLIEAIQNTAEKIRAYDKTNLAVLSYFLYRSSPAGVWFDLRKPAIAEQIQESLNNRWGGRKIKA